MPLGVRVYVTLVAACGLGAMATSFWSHVPMSAFMFLVGMQLVLRLAFTPKIRHGVGVTEQVAVALAAVILLPLGPAAVVAALIGLPGSKADAIPVKIVFNIGQLAITGAAASLAYHAVGGPSQIGIESFPGIFWPVALAIVVYCVVNGSLVSGILRLTRNMPFFKVWREALAESVAFYLGYSVMGLLMAVLWEGRFEGFGAALVLVPLLVARWTFGQYSEEQRAYQATIRTLIQAIEIKDHYTRGHSERVARGVELIGKQLGMSDSRVASLRYAGTLHDVGKLGVPTRLLQKSGPLSEQEIAAIQLHPVRGIDIVRDISFLGEAYQGILYHHERLDGEGYPSGLAGDDIPEFARAIAVADAFDSMTSTRSYRGARPVPVALAELWRCAGSQFDPVMVKALTDGVDTHGWSTSGTVPQPLPPGAAVDSYDHDDPTAEPLIRRATAAGRGSDPIGRGESR